MRHLHHGGDGRKGRKEAKMSPVLPGIELIKLNLSWFRSSLVVLDLEDLNLIVGVHILKGLLPSGYCIST